MNIVFTGLRGTGKTSLGKEVAKQLQMPFFDIDLQIEKKAKISVKDIVQQYGWKRFRQLEHQVCKDISKKGNCVIATGGGTLIFERNRKLFSKNCIIVWLKLELSEMVRNIECCKNRPRLTEAVSLKKEIQLLMRERYPVYAAVSHLQYEVNNGKHFSGNIPRLVQLLQRLCVPIIAGTTAEAQRKIRKAYAQGAAFTELRLDLCGDLSPEKLDLSRTILTPREHKINTLAKSQGSKNPRFIDIEAADMNKKIIQQVKSRGSKLIISHHDFQKTPSLTALKQKAQSLFSQGADIVKIATHIARYRDTETLLKFAKQYSGRCIVVGMGVKSEPTRLLARMHGSLLTFASFNERERSAPGQLTIDEHLLHPFMTPETELYGIIGNPVAHSLSPKLHNSLFRKHQLNAVYLRLPCDQIKNDFNDLIRLGFSGFSVTAPWKETIIPLLDHVDPIAKKIGSVNTIVMRNKKSFGYNTDWIGVMETLKPYRKKIKKAVILGYGGAAKAVIFALQKLGVKEIMILRRKTTPLPFPSDSFNNFSQYDYDIVINTTPVDNPINIDELRKGKIAFDLRYTPSKFLDAAKKKHNTNLNGSQMFLHQGLEQFRLWTTLEPEFHDIKL